MNEYLNKKRSSGNYGKQETLPPSLQTKMNQSFGMDFSSVKVYRNDEMAGTGMKGLASGNRVILSKEINLNTLEGQAVLGHELSHIHAQSQGIGGGHSGLYDNAALEHQADTEGRMAAMGQSVYGAPGGMPIFAGMQNMGGLQPLSGGLSASAGAPLQAKKARKRSNAVYNKEGNCEFDDGRKTIQEDLPTLQSLNSSDSDFIDALYNLKTRESYIPDEQSQEVQDSEPFNQASEAIESRLQGMNEKAQKSFLNIYFGKQMELKKKMYKRYKEKKKMFSDYGEKTQKNHTAFIMNNMTKEGRQLQGMQYANITIGMNLDPDILEASIKKQRKEEKKKYGKQFAEYESMLDNDRKKYKDRRDAYHRVTGEDALEREEIERNRQRRKAENYFGVSRLPKPVPQTNAISTEKEEKQEPLLQSDDLILPIQIVQNDPNQSFSSVHSDSSSEDWEDLRACESKEDKVPEEIDRAYDKLANHQKNQLSTEQHHAFDNYISDSGQINSVLRGTQKSTPLILSTIDAIDSGMQTTKSDLTAFRGVSDFALISAIQQDPKLAKKLLKKDGKIDYKKLEKDPTLLNGLEFTDKGYSSTSVQESFSEKWRKGILASDAKRITESDLTKKYLKKDLKDKESFLSNHISNFNSEHPEEFLNIKTPEDVEKLPKRQQDELRGTMYMQHEEDPNFPETTEEDLLNRGMGSHLYEIRVPKNTKGTFIDKMRFDNDGNYTDAGQKELLLDRGTRYKINGIKHLMDENGIPLKNQYRILMEVVGQKHYEVK